MEVIIIYDAEYPSTRIIARAIGKGFSDQSRVRLADASLIDGRDLPEMQLLIVGSPYNKSRASKAIRSFLTKLSNKALENVAVAAFETYTKRSFLIPSFFGRSAKRNNLTGSYIDKMLIKKGGVHVLSPERFTFRTQSRPYSSHELYNAAQWGKELESLSRI
jgi:menaquinone-dependent protoporphyrinogen IX oxidase